MGTENTTSKYVEIKNYTVLLPVTVWAKYVNPRGPKKHTKNLGPVERSIIYSFFFERLAAAYTLRWNSIPCKSCTPYLSFLALRSGHSNIVPIRGLKVIMYINALRHQYYHAYNRHDKECLLAEYSWCRNMHAFYCITVSEKFSWMEVKKVASTLYFISSFHKKRTQKGSRQFG